MLASAIIAKKRDQQELNADEIQFMISGLVDGSVPDYQMSAWAMAVLCRGMSSEETSLLTQCMLDSGSRLKRCTDRPRVDKHSTGGLGDKVSLILAPLLACFDLDVPMLSGRGLGITGGTLDKLEAYDGYRCDLSEAEINAQLQSIGCVITGTTPNITPADRKLYGLRDVTGTVPSIPLITASILSKKLSESLDALAFDVKFGSAAFMQNLRDARTLGESLQSTATHMSLTSQVVLSDMNQPLGTMVGNACEANEAIDVLQGGGPPDVRELTLRLCAELLVATNKQSNLSNAAAALATELDSGRPLSRWIQMIEHQGGQFVEHLPLAQAFTFESRNAGWLAKLDGQKLGQAVIELGGGRRRLGDALNHQVGLEMLVRVGDRIEPGQPLLRVFAASPDDFTALHPLLSAAVEFSPEPVSTLPLFADPTPELDMPELH